MSKILVTLILGVFLPLSSALAENAAIRQAYDDQQAESAKCEADGGTFKPGEGCLLSDSNNSAPEPTRNYNQSSFVQQESAAPAVWGEACRQATESAIFGCDVDENPTIKLTVDMAKMLKKKMEQDTGASQGALCSQVGNVAKQLNMAQAAYAGYCTAGYLNCQNVCAGDLNTIRSAIPTGAATQADIEGVNANMKRCRALANSLVTAKQSLEQYAMMNQAKAQQCKTAVNTAVPGTGADSPACQANPASPECLKAMAGTSDCSNPSSTDLVCVCARSPGDPKCLGVGGGFGPMGRTGGGIASTGGSVDAGSFGGLSGDGSGFGGGSAIQGVKPNAAGGQPMGGRGGGGGGGGMGGGKGAPAAAGGGGAAGTGYNTKTIAGYGFGGGAGRGGGAGGAGAPGGRPGYGMPGQKPGQGNVDLRQFLPGGRMDPSRGLAGISGPDGITGPNSNIWKKINARYFSVQPSLLP